MSISSEFQKIERFLGGHYKVEQEYILFNTYHGVDQNSNERVSFILIRDLFKSKFDSWRVLEEIQRNSLFQHENIARVTNIKISNKEDDSKKIIFVMERLDTNLQRIINSNQKLSIEQRRFIMYLILRGLKYIHSGNVVHRYLRPDKILINANCDIKIDTLNYDYHFYTHWYRSPESLTGSTEEESFATDIWSLGCIFYQLITRKPLFDGTSVLDQLIKIVKTIGSPNNIDEDLYFVKHPKAIEFMRSIQKVDEPDFEKLFENGTMEEIELLKMMLKWNPSKRITVEEALKHPYFEMLHDESDEPTCQQINVLPRKFMYLNEFKKFIWNEIQKIVDNKYDK